MKFRTCQNVLGSVGVGEKIFWIGGGGWGWVHYLIMPIKIQPLTKKMKLKKNCIFGTVLLKLVFFECALSSSLNIFTSLYGTKLKL